MQVFRARKRTIDGSGERKLQESEPAERQSEKDRRAPAEPVAKQGGEKAEDDGAEGDITAELDGVVSLFPETPRYIRRPTSIS